MYIFDVQVMQGVLLTFNKGVNFVFMFDGLISVGG